MKSNTTGCDIFQSLESCIEEHSSPRHILYVWPLMCSINVGVAGLVRNKLNNLESNGINFISMHAPRRSTL